MPLILPQTSSHAPFSSPSPHGSMSHFNIFRRKSSKLGESLSGNRSSSPKNSSSSSNRNVLLSPSVNSPLSSPSASANSVSRRDSKFSFSSMLNRTSSNSGSNGSDATRRPAEGAHRPFTTPGIHADAPPSYTAATTPGNPNSAAYGPASYGLGNSTSPATNPYASGSATPAPAADSPFAALANFDTVFLIDDSGSMAGRSWREVSHAIRTIAPICTTYDADGIDLHFLNAPDQPFFSNIKSAATVDEIFSQVRPYGGTPTGTRLHQVLKPYLARCEDVHRRGLEGGVEAHVKPLNVIVITDGVPTDDVESTVLSACKKLESVDAVPWQVGIQFFQVGEETGAREALKELDDDLQGRCAGGRDIVDTVPWSGVQGKGVFSASSGGQGNGGQEEAGKEVLKVVLGAVNRRLDRRSLDSRREPVVVVEQQAGRGRRR